VLNGRLALFDVDDTESLAARALADQLRSMGASLREHERDDALAYLIATVWEASLKYDPERFLSFSTFAYQLSRRRTIDWFRGRFGRTRWSLSNGYEHDRERPDIYPLEAALDGELEGALGGGQGHFADDRSPDLLGVLTDRSR
jgi:DNA-directed RNA polymerase specialized sigma24 family protein